MSKTLTFLLFLHDEAELPVCKLEAELEYSSKHRDEDNEEPHPERLFLPKLETLVLSLDPILN